MPLFFEAMSEVDIDVHPMANGCSFPSANTATIVPFSAGVIFALGCVSPGHIMLAPDKTNLIAPFKSIKSGVR